MKEEPKIDRMDYYVTYRWMSEILGLKGYQLIMYAIIYGFSHNEGGSFYGTLNYLQEWTGASRQSVVTALSSLVELGLIDKEESFVNGSKRCMYSVRQDKVPVCVDRVELSSDGNNYNHSLKIRLCKIHSLKIRPSHSLKIRLNNKEDTIDRNKEKVIKEKKEVELEAVKETEVVQETSQPTEEKKPTKRKKTENKRPNCEEYKQMVFERHYEERLESRVLAWLDYKTERGDTYTPSGWSTMLKRIENETANYSVGKMCKCIDECISREYKGIIFDLMEKMATQRPKYQRLD